MPSIIIVAESNCKMNKEKFLRYFKKKENTSENNEDVTVTNVVTSVTKDITNAELSFAANEIKKSHSRPKQYQKKIPEYVKIEVGKHASIFETFSTIKRFSLKYPKHRFIRTSVNDWNSKVNGITIRAPNKILGVPGSKKFWMSCKITQK